VTWQRSIESGTNHSSQPAYFFAAWAEPDEAFQVAHFGKVMISGDDLINYSLWNAGLTPHEDKEWEDLLAGLHPADDLKAKLRGFVFSEELPPAGTNAPTTGPSAYLRELFKMSNP
jgi:hypothetical protein